MRRLPLRPLILVHGCKQPHAVTLCLQTAAVWRYFNIQKKHIRLVRTLKTSTPEASKEKWVSFPGIKHQRRLQSSFDCSTIQFQQVEEEVSVNFGAKQELEFSVFFSYTASNLFFFRQTRAKNFYLQAPSRQNWSWWMYKLRFCSLQPSGSKQSSRTYTCHCCCFLNSSSYWWLKDHRVMKPAQSGIETKRDEVIL